MKKYWGLIRCGFLEACTYRSNFLTGMLANFIQTAVLYYVWQSIFHYQETVGGMTWDLMRRYVFVSFLCNSAFSFGFEMDTAKKIIQGDIILDLIKPAGYRGMVFFRMAGNAVMEFSMSFLFIGSLYLFVNGLQGITPCRLLLFLVSLLLGQGIKFSIQYLFSLLCFYTENAYGVVKTREVLTNFFSGAVIPLSMFPAFFRQGGHLLPFQGIVYTPCSIFLGTLDFRESLYAMGIQVLWILLLWLAGSLFWRKASSVISLYGG